MLEMRLLKRPLLLGSSGDIRYDFHSINKEEYRALYFYNPADRRNHHYNPGYRYRFHYTDWHFYGQTYTELR